MGGVGGQGQAKFINPLVNCDSLFMTHNTSGIGEGGLGAVGGGGRCGLLGRMSDRHAAEAGAIPRCGKGFFSHFLPESTFSADSDKYPYTPACNCVH